MKYIYLKKWTDKKEVYWEPAIFVDFYINTGQTDPISVFKPTSLHGICIEKDGTPILAHCSDIKFEFQGMPEGEHLRGANIYE